MASVHWDMGYVSAQRYDTSLGNILRLKENCIRQTLSNCIHTALWRENLCGIISWTGMKITCGKLAGVFQEKYGVSWQLSRLENQVWLVYNKFSKFVPNSVTEGNVDVYWILQIKKILWFVVNFWFSQESVFMLTLSWWWFTTILQLNLSFISISVSLKFQIS